MRADVEESYIDSVRLGDKFARCACPPAREREGTVFFRGMDADYATQRDVSRTKRDIKTFEIRLRCDNHDRALAVGMTAYVTLPLPAQSREHVRRRSRKPGQALRRFLRRGPFNFRWTTARSSACSARTARANPPSSAC